MRSSKILDFIFGYEKGEKNFKGSKIAESEGRFADRVVRGVSSAYANKILKSPISRLLSKIRESFALTSSRAYGSMLLSFGLITLLANFADFYFRSSPAGPIFQIIVGTALIALAIPFLFGECPLGETLAKNKTVSYILFEVFCIKKPQSPVANSSAIPTVAAIAIGCIIGVIGYFVPLQIVLFVILGLLFLSLSIDSPEFSLLFSVFILPALPSLPFTSVILCILTGVGLLSYVGKVLIGKRNYHFEQYDLFLIGFSLFILISGIFNKGFESFEKSVIMILMISVYALASNLIVNKRLADNVINVFLLSSAVTGIYGILKYFLFEDFHPEWTDPAFADSISGRATASFGNPNIYAVYLIVAIIFSLLSMINSASGAGTALYFAALAINVTALVLTWTRGAWAALVLSLFAILIIKSVRAPKLLLIPLGLVPIGLAFIPDSVTERFLSIFNLADSSIASRLSVWRSSINMFADNVFLGVGMGEESFREEFLRFSEDGVTAPHSHNILLEIGCEAGVFALLLFVMLLLTRIRHMASYAKLLKHSTLRPAAIMTFVATFALLTFGMTDYIWYSSTMAFLFFLVFGLGSASLRISKIERDERYYVGASTVDSASVNISVYN